MGVARAKREKFNEIVHCTGWLSPVGVVLGLIILWNWVANVHPMFPNDHSTSWIGMGFLAVGLLGCLVALMVQVGLWFGWWGTRVPTYDEAKLATAEPATT